jgi:hypothetical protein
VIPLEKMPGYSRWGSALPALLALEMPLWVHGEPGSGITSVAAWLAERRGQAFQDDAELLDPALRSDWIRKHPKGVLGAHRPPEDASVAPCASRCVALRLFSFEEDPESMDACLALLAQEEGLAAPLPPALGLLPCPGNLRGLRNRLVRWKLLGQLPEDGPTAGTGPLPLEAEDLATNLHVLERLLLHRALRRSYGNRVEAARRLGVSRRQLYLLIARHGDPVRGEVPTSTGPKRLGKQRSRQNSSTGDRHR